MSGDAAAPTGTQPAAPERLRIALLVYRGKPHCGGQGVYTARLSKALTDLGHHVEVFSGPPYPILDERVPLNKLPSLELYDEPHPFRTPAPWEYKTWIDFAEWLIMSAAGFAEPWSFSMRVKRALLGRLDDFDIVHDNQSLGTGLLAVQEAGLPILGTIHHPITVDRRIEIAAAPTLYRKIIMRRWYGFTRMQTRVAKQLPLIVTVSESSLGDIVKDHGVVPGRLKVVNVGVDPDHFRPLPHIGRVPGRIMTTTSSDLVMKGLLHLLEAVAKLRTERPDVHLTVIGKPIAGGTVDQSIERLGLGDAVEFLTNVSDDRLVELYAEAELAVVPSLYEGFSLPAIEAMAAGVPLVATTGGAVPEVVGRDGTTAALVPPGDAGALAAMIAELLDDPTRRERMAAAGRTWAVERYSWRVAAEQTVELYRKVLEMKALGVSPPGPARARALVRSLRR